MNPATQLPAWIRLHASNPQKLEELCKDHCVDLLPQPIARPGATMRIRCTRLEGKQVLVTDLLWYQGNDAQPTFTVETGHRVLRMEQVFERIQSQGLPAGSSQSVSLVLLHQLLGQTALVLDRIDQGFSVSMKTIRGFQLNAGTDRVCGAEDLAEIDNHLSMLNKPLLFVLQSLHDLEQASLRLRRMAKSSSTLTVEHVDELVAEIEGVQRRARLVLECQLFQRSAAGETVAMSDLNVNKVFNVLWAAFIPGTALINWYGQNFRFMPELSWDGSLWTQLLAVLVLTAVPVLMVKHSGALR